MTLRSVMTAGTAPRERRWRRHDFLVNVTVFLATMTFVVVVGVVGLLVVRSALH